MEGLYLSFEETESIGICYFKALVHIDRQLFIWFS